MSLQSAVSLSVQYPIPLILIVVLVVTAIASYAVPLMPGISLVIAMALIVFSAFLIIFFDICLDNEKRKDIIRWTLAILISVILTFSISPWFGNSIVNIILKLMMGAVALSVMAICYMGLILKAEIKKWEDGHSLKSL